MNQKETQYIQSLELENAKLKQEIALLKSKLFIQQSPTQLGFEIAIFPVYPPNSNHPFRD